MLVSLSSPIYALSRATAAVGYLVYISKRFKLLRFCTYAVALGVPSWVAGAFNTGCLGLGDACITNLLCGAIQADLSPLISISDGCQGIGV